MIAPGLAEWTDRFVLPIPLHGPPTQTAAFANPAQLRGVRGVAPRDGTLNSLWYWLGSGTGVPVCGAVYRTNRKTLLRTKLWQGAWGNSATTGAWVSFGNPGVSVRAGDWLELCAACDTTVPTWLRTQTWQGVASPPAPFIQAPPTPEWQNLGDTNNRPADASALIGGDFMSWHVFGNGMGNGVTFPATLTIDAITWASPPVFLVAGYA